MLVITIKNVFIHVTVSMVLVKLCTLVYRQATILSASHFESRRHILFLQICQFTKEGVRIQMCISEHYNSRSKIKQ